MPQREFTASRCIHWHSEREPGIAAAGRVEPCHHGQRCSASSLVPQLCPLQNTALSKSTKGNSK